MTLIQKSGLVTVVIAGICACFTAMAQQAWVSPVTNYILRTGAATLPVDETLTAPVISPLPQQDPDATVLIQWSGNASHFIVEITTQVPAQAETDWLVLYEGSANSRLVTGLADGEFQVRAKACANDACSEYSYSSIGSVNKTLVAQDDEELVGLHQTLAFYVLHNDFDPDNEALSIDDIETPPNFGSATVSADGQTISYQNTQDQCGSASSFTDTLSYRIRNQSGQMSQPATVSITVLCPNAWASEWVASPFSDLAKASLYQVYLGQGVIYFKGPPSHWAWIGMQTVPVYKQGDIFRLVQVDGNWQLDYVTLRQFKQQRNGLQLDPSIEYVDADADGVLDILVSPFSLDGRMAMEWRETDIVVGQGPVLYWQIPAGVSCTSTALAGSSYTGFGVQALPPYYTLGEQAVPWLCHNAQGELIYDLPTTLNINRLPAPININQL